MWMIQISLAKLVMWSKNISHTWHVVQELSLALFPTRSHINNCTVYLMQNDPGNPVLWKCPQLAVIWCCIWHPLKIALCYWWALTISWEVMYYWCQRDEFLVMRVLVTMEYLMKKEKQLLLVKYKIWMITDWWQFELPFLEEGRIFAV